MRIIDELNNIIENPDLELGKIVSEAREVVFRYDITQHEQGHYETVKEYPNGGKEVEWVVDVPELGRWVAYDEDGGEVETDIEIPEDAPHEVEIPTLHEFARYVLFSDDEKAKNEAAKQLAAASAEFEETREAFEGFLEELFSAKSLNDLLAAIMNKNARELMARRKELRAKITEAAGIAAE